MGSEKGRGGVKGERVKGRGQKREWVKKRGRERG